MQRKAPSPGSRSTSTDSEAQAVANDTGIVSQAGSFSRKPPAAWSTSVQMLACVDASLRHTFATHLSHDK